MDIYLPNIGEAPYPTVVLVHGGGFSHMDKRDWHVYPGFFALREGFALVSVNYRLAPKHKYPQGLNDVKGALKHMAAAAATYGLDTNNVFLEGTSAGGNFVTLAALMPDAWDHGLRVRGVAALCPGCSLADMYAGLKDTRNLLMKFLIRRTAKQYLGVLPHRDPGPITQASAETWVLDAAEKGRPVPPFYILQGDTDPLIQERHTRKFYELMKAKLHLPPGDLVYRVLQGAGHAGGGPEFFEEQNIMGFIQFFKERIEKLP
jgi:acetyl esterase/lipase